MSVHRLALPRDVLLMQVLAYVVLFALCLLTAAGARA
jgi:hypothetical protein